MTVLSARTLEDKPVVYAQDAGHLSVTVAEANRDTPVTVVELTLSQPLESGLVIDGASTVPEDDTETVGPPPGQE